MSGEWVYTGDVNIECGGTFFKLDESDQRHGYMEAVQVTDLASATGADGLLLVERRTVLFFEDKDKVRDALSFYGWTPKDLRGQGKETVLLMLAEALLGADYSDPAGNYDSVGDTFVIVDDSYCGNKSSWDGWGNLLNKEQTVLLHHHYDGDVKQYVESEFCW